MGTLKTNDIIEICINPRLIWSGLSEINLINTKCLKIHNGLKYNTVSNVLYNDRVMPLNLFVLFSIHIKTFGISNAYNVAPIMVIPIILVIETSLVKNAAKVSPVA